MREEKKVNIPQETETSKRRFKRPVWETSLNEASEEEYIPADIAKELIEAKSNEAIYTDPKELEAKLTSERQKKHSCRNIIQQVTKRRKKRFNQR